MKLLLFMFHTETFCISTDNYHPTTVDVVPLVHQEGWVNSLRPSKAYMRRYTNHHWFRWWLVTWTAPSHYLNHCWNIVNWTLGNKLQWNFNLNSNIFIQEIHLKIENVVCEMASICLGLNELRLVAPDISHQYPGLVQQSIDHSWHYNYVTYCHSSVLMSAMYLARHKWVK